MLASNSGISHEITKRRKVHYRSRFIQGLRPLRWFTTRLWLTIYLKRQQLQKSFILIFHMHANTQSWQLQVIVRQFCHLMVSLRTDKISWSLTTKKSLFYAINDFRLQHRFLLMSLRLLIPGTCQFRCSLLFWFSVNLTLTILKSW